MRCATARALATGVLLWSVAAAQADIFRPSKEDQVKLGTDAAAKVRKSEKLLPDDHPRVRLLRSAAQRILDAIPADQRKKEIWKFSFDVIDKKEVNAFAFPGGPIFFFNGLIDKLETEDQLAGVLAHEMTHVRNQHWASAYADNMKRRLGITAILTIFNAGSSAFDIAGVADDLLVGLPYSRKHESEADRVGLDLMVRAGYNPEGLEFVMRMFASEGGRPWEFVSSHPDPNNRSKAIAKWIKESGKTFPPSTPLSPEVRKKADGQGVKQPAATKKDG
ncbi:MAG: M48 family metallopeptidase [Fimbriimonadaceae bacterium]|nr:M48 family metallopeptidase [Fimbriimonadaceae bacterium]